MLAKDVVMSQYIHSLTPGFFHKGTIDIWGWVILCCEGVVLCIVGCLTVYIVKEQNSAE